MSPTLSRPSTQPARRFVFALDKLFHLRDCLDQLQVPTEDPDVKNIDEFLASLSAAPAAPAKSAPTTSSTTTTATTPAATTASPSTTPSRLESALNADGLAQRLGVDPQTGAIPATAPQHLLMVKALESGGSVNHSTNIFGTKMSFSGGSVGTYALFNLDGQLECSGNVYDYAGPIASKDFEQTPPRLQAQPRHPGHLPARHLPPAAVTTPGAPMSDGLPSDVGTLPH
jgi:hypothetical protein